MWMIGDSLGLFWGSPFWRAGVPMAMECVFGFRYVQGVSWQEVKTQLNEGANTHDFCIVLSLGWPPTSNLMYKNGVWILPSFSGISFAQCRYISCSGLLLNTWTDDIWNGEGRFKKWQIFIYPQWQGSAPSGTWTTGTDEGDLLCVLSFMLYQSLNNWHPSTVSLAELLKKSPFSISVESIVSKACVNPLRA